MILNFKQIFFALRSILFQGVIFAYDNHYFATTTFQIKITSIYIVVIALIYWIGTNILH